jgi:hypothetical protein
MAVLQFVPDLPRCADVVLEGSAEHVAEKKVVADSPARIFSPVITPPRVSVSVLMPFLRFAAELALRSTGAAGCAVAMRAGSGFRCYASVGDAPPVDAPVRLAGSLTGLCVRKGKTIRRDDLAEEETGDVSGYAGRARSIVLAPIFQDGNVGGVIGIFSPEPQAFLDEHQTALEHVAGVVAIALLHPQRLEASSEMAEAYAEAGMEPIPVPVYEPVAPVAADRAAQALENLARAITSAITHAQRPALPSEEVAPVECGQPRKRLYGLPCSKCGAYFTSEQPACSVCGTPRAARR